jgi:hypothetical protein
MRVYTQPPPLIPKGFMPAAEKAKVILGLEDSVSAEDNVRMFDRVGPKYVTEFWDVGLASALGFDPIGVEPNPLAFSPWRGTSD